MAMKGIQGAPDDVVIEVCQHLSVRDILAFRQVSFRPSAWEILVVTRTSRRRADMRSQYRVSKYCGCPCAPPASLLEEYPSQTRIASMRCPQESWRSRFGRPSNEIIACTPGPRTTTSTNQRGGGYGRRPHAQPSLKSSSFPILPNTRVGVW